MTQDQSAKLEWRSDLIPVSTQFDDPYFSLENGLEETRHVFLAGNDLPARFSDGFHVAELGFGTGLNMLATLIAWRASGAVGRLRYTSFEAFPMDANDVAKALSAFPEALAVADDFLTAWKCGLRQFDLGGFEVSVILGDARQTLTAWSAQADAWYLDGFSPAKNPELWGADLMDEVGKHTAPGGTAATYTAAGFVRRGLEEAGFDVERVPGFGRKRHMTLAVRP